VAKVDTAAERRPVQADGRRHGGEEIAALDVVSVFQDRAELPEQRTLGHVREAVPGQAAPLDSGDPVGDRGQDALLLLVQVGDEQLV
jgi:hypothetical protein